MNRQEFIMFAEESQESLRRYLVALCCGNAWFADEIAQESLIKAYLGCEGFRDRSKFKTWLFTIAHNTFLNYKRQTVKSADEKEITNKMAAEPDPFRYQALYLALEKLSGTERSSILLYYLEGYSVREIGKITGQSAEAVRKSMQRGRQHLKNLLNNDE